MPQYNKEEMIKLSLKAIEDNNLVFVHELCYYLPFTRTTFYNKELDKVDKIKEALNKNKVDIKKGLRNKWYISDNATTQLALYRLLATKEEHDKLNNTMIIKEEESKEAKEIKENMSPDQASQIYSEQMKNDK